MNLTLTKIISSLDIKTDPFSLRTFGFGLAVILSGFAGIGYWLNSTPNFWLLCAGMLSAFLTIISFRLLLPIYYPWMIIARLLGMIITYILLTITYYLVLMPIGFIMRFTSNDPLSRKWGGASYWEERENGGDKRMNRMF